MAAHIDGPNQGTAASTGDLTPSTALSNDILVVYFPAPPKQDWIERVKNCFPGLQIRWFTRQGDLAQEALTAENLRGATLLCSLRPPKEPGLIDNVRFVQLSSAGADRWLTHEKYRDPKTVFCTANGVHPPQIAEWVIGTYLLMNRHFLDYAAHQRVGFWAKGDGLNKKYEPEDSPGKRIGILGYGAIGRHVARIASAMGMEVYAYTRSPRITPESRRDDSYVVPGTGDPDGCLPAAWFHGGARADVNAFLAQDLDILVVSLPLTEATRHIIDREQLAILGRKRAFVSNIARGGHVNGEALLEALQQGIIRGAALDVTDPEPLPSEHPLWRAPNCFITPHISWITPLYWDRTLDILEANLANLAAGKPLINVMNREFHY